MPARSFAALAATSCAAFISMTPAPTFASEGDPHGHRAIERAIINQHQTKSIASDSAPTATSGRDRMVQADDQSLTPMSPRGGASWSPLGPFGGDVQDVAFSPSTPGLGLAGIAPAGSSGGALFRTTNGGNTWTIVSQLANISVYDIEWGSGSTVFIATIDSVWKSTDGGATFTAFNLGIGLNDQIFDLTIHPTNPNEMWIAIADALGTQPVNIMQTTNGGTNWFNRTPPMGVARSGRAIAINPNNPLEIYAGFTQGQLWVSTDGGTSWVNRSAGLPNAPINALVHDGTRAIVTGGQLFGSQNFGVFQSTNQGVTWTPMHDGSWPSLVIHDFAFEPGNVNTRYAVSATAGVFRSMNGGAWQFGVGGTGIMSLNSIRTGPAVNPGLVVGANSIGVLQSSDGGNSFANTSTGISKLDVFSIASNSNDINEMAIAFQGLNNGGVYRTTDGGQTWVLQNCPPTRYSHVAFAPNGTLYAISSGPTSIATEGVYRRGSNGTWTPLGPDQGTLFESELGFMAFSASDPNLFFAVGNDFGVAGSEATIWRTTAGGGAGAWTKVYEGPAASESVTDIKFVGGSNDQELIASFVDFSASATGGLLRTTHAGDAGTWAPSMNGLPAGVQAKALSPSPASPQTFLLADRRFGAAGGLYRTTDGGQSWTSTGFAGQTWDVAVDPFDANVVYTMQTNATSVWKSTDGGASFSPFNTGLSFSGSPRDLFYAKRVGSSAPKLLLATTAGTFGTDLPVPCSDADINCDGAVNVTDLLAVIQTWGACPSPPAACPADIAPAPSGDGVVNVADLLMVISNWG